MKTQPVIYSLIVIIVLLIARCTNGPVKTLPQSGTAEPLAKPVNSGKLLYEEKCALCHGSDGTAGISNAANLQKSILDTSSMILTITHGKNGMPAFKEQLDSVEIKQIVYYVFTLRK
jgi:cytochrome c6